ncbi:ECF transporter S component [Microbacterium sp. p3-SID336]|uniref:ECF transporter S component n=1 Tax=Microbacterium sp. p3-SID336 TaxID=2916212 RepID=UPI0021A7B4CE|nr:ECF transporter S component [Microbacterium sp. p3-SID336]MCT1477152.1 ECF transporter S component [Microbacterium sp. p3-SID336]
MTNARGQTTVRRVPTSALLVSAALGAIQALVFVAVVPVTSVLAVSSPPAYALVAAVHTALPLLARVVTRTPGMAAFTAFVCGVLTVAVSPIGLLGVVPLLIGGLVLDATLPLRRDVRAHPVRILLAGAAAGVVLFLVALPVFSPDHLVPGVLVATLLARIAGELLIAAAVIALRRLLARAGVAR